MAKLDDSDATSPSPNAKSRASRHEAALATGRLLADAETSDFDNDQIVMAARQLIAIYDMPYDDLGVRSVAAETVVRLAERHAAVLELVIENAKEYARISHIDDADPYSPNSFDVLAKLGQASEKIVLFLEQMVRNEWGIPRWSAIRVLCELSAPTADRILYELVKGQYPPPFPQMDSDLRLIESVRGRDFVVMVQRS